MKTILLIGLGRFGRHVAMKLHELNHQVMAVDQDEEKVNRILPYVTSAQIGDSTNEEFLASLGYSLILHLQKILPVRTDHPVFYNYASAIVPNLREQ